MVLLVWVQRQRGGHKDGVCSKAESRMGFPTGSGHSLASKKEEVIVGRIGEIAADVGSYDVE